MSRSENGWPVIKSQADRNLVITRIPGTGYPGIPLRLQKDAAPILTYVAARVHAEVSDLKLGNKPGVQDEGGYNYRKMDTGTSFSNHASGTAIDLNWTRWPMFRRKMSKKERTAAEAIASELSEVIRWGGHYSPARVDEMHWEIKPGVTAGQLKAFCRKLGLDKNGKVR